PPRTPDRAPGRLLALALAAGLALDLGLRGGVANGVVAAGTALIVTGLLTDGRVAQRPARLLAWGALVPAAFLSLRTSPWVASLDVAAIVVLIGAAVAFSRSGSLTDTLPRAVAARLARALERAGSAPRLLAPLVPRASALAGERAGRILRALVVAVPMLAVVVALLASADAVFASFFDVDVDAGPAIGHVVLVAWFALIVVGLLGAPGAEVSDAEPGGPFGAIEVTTMLGLAAGVLGLFVLSQVVALTEAGHRLVASSGQTPAEYARSGFFQLCWATAIVAVFLAVTHGLADTGVMARRGVRVLAALVPILALGLVVVSLRRMALYDEAFGLTMLRLWVVGATVWFGVVLVLVALRNAGVGGARHWLLAGAGATALVLVLAANLADPEAYVVRHNVSRARAGADLDTDYLRGLSDDAVGALADAAAREPDPELRRQLVAAARCDQDATGAAALNLAARRAAEARRELCSIGDR
ncbi:MAG: hypothetical protein JWM47_3701, partial [Acidimicrobiales bacterium]|nr:hypothetical protein [Acidimicrobiales bacterium]